MIKAVAYSPKGDQALILGLSGENVTRLVAGEPIRFNLAELSGLAGRAGLPLPDLTVAIFYGRDDQALLDQLNLHANWTPP